MFNFFSFTASLLIVSTVCFAQEAGVQSGKNASQTKTVQAASAKKSSFKQFTGKIVGNHVRMRVSPDLESHIVSELSKDDYIVVKGEKGEFFAVTPPQELNAYLFRGFVIDDMVEGDRVNVRLAPDREAPIIAHYSTGKPINGVICEENNKWLRISVPEETSFYISKEFIDYVGGPELKAVNDKRKQTVSQLLESANLLSQSEMRKPFNEIDLTRVKESFSSIINDYSDFPSSVSSAAKSMAALQEDYLNRKIAFLEAKASKMTKGQSDEFLYETTLPSGELTSSSDRMKVWEPKEEAIYLSWSSMHHSKTMDDFYRDQKLKSSTISGILEAFKEPVKSKPGDFILKVRDVPVAYVYSTHINLEDYVGKQVNLVVAKRPANDFAFPAYYAIDID